MESETRINMTEEKIPRTRGGKKYEAESAQTFHKKITERWNPKGKNPGDVSVFWDANNKPTLEEYLECCIEYYLSQDEFWDVPTKANSDKHYASYNSTLIDKPIIAGCPEGGIIIDPFAGTGTTINRAIQLNRYGIGIEGNKDYCEIARGKINNLFATTA